MTVCLNIGGEISILRYRIKQKWVREMLHIRSPNKLKDPIISYNLRT